jgi:hypothetical protein
MGPAGPYLGTATVTLQSEQKSTPFLRGKLSANRPGFAVKSLPILFEVFPRPSPDAACWSAPMQSIVRRILVIGVTFGWSIACAHLH